MALLIDHGRPRALERAPRLFPDSVPAPQAPAPRTDEPATAAEPHGATLDDLLTGTWARLTSGVATTCPVCTGELAPLVRLHPLLLEAADFLAIGVDVGHGGQAIPAVRAVASGPPSA